MIRLRIEEKETLAYLRELDKEYYPPSGSYELYDYKSDTWYNRSGQVLRSPDEYDPYSEGYTPFGDE
jgi:hypothetical protein